MELAGLAVGVLAATLTVGQEVYDLCQILGSAREDVAERCQLIQVQWAKTHEHVKIIERTWTSLSPEYQASQTKAFMQLLKKLETARELVKGLLKVPAKAGGGTGDVAARPAVKRFKYLFVKRELEATMKSIETWQSVYEPSFWLLMRVDNPVVDAAFKRDSKGGFKEVHDLQKTALRVRQAIRPDSLGKVHLSLPADAVDNMETRSIAFSTARHVKRLDRRGKVDQCIIDSIPCPPGSYVGEMDNDIRMLATKLHSSDPNTFGVLKCRGLIKSKSSTGGRLKSFEIVLDTPSPDEPRTLRSCLLSKTAHSLSERTHLARQLARSTSYVHIWSLVHKNIRPENFLGFGQDRLGDFFLVGFEHVRTADGRTYMRGDRDWHKNIYRHPERQGASPSEKYVMQHDIYSLGVCLLEIGLWDSLVLYGLDGKVESPNTDLLGLPVEQLARKRPEAIKRLLVDMAKRRLPALVGEVYTGVVVNCLTCLDDDNEDFNDLGEAADADGVSIGVRFIEQILTELSSIAV